MLEMLRQLCTLAQLHRQLLPREIPHWQGWRVAVHYSAGLWPGSDYYDFLPCADGRILCLITAASDQGAASTALALMVRIVLHACPLGSHQPPHMLLRHLNRVLAENTLAEQYITAFCGVLDPLDGSFHFANAGHPSPRWWRAAQCLVEAVRDATGRPLGTDRQASYQAQAIRIEPGDLLVLYSDSLTAALNKSGERFGWERLDAALRAAAPGGAEAVKSAVLARFEDFLAGEDSLDEITLVVMERQKETG